MKEEPEMVLKTWTLLMIWMFLTTEATEGHSPSMGSCSISYEAEVQRQTAESITNTVEGDIGTRDGINNFR
jgi:hypothetical protein